MKKFLLFLLITVVLYTPFLVYLVRLEHRVGDLDHDATYSYPVYEGDSIDFAALGDHLVSTHTFSLQDGKPETFRTPGYPLFLAVVRIFRLPYLVVPFLQMLMVAGTSLLLYFIGKNHLAFSPAFAWLAGLLYIIDFTTMFNTILIGTDILFVFLLMLIVYLVLQKRNALFIGLLLGYAILVRPVGMYLPILFLPWIRSWKKIVIFLIGFAIILSPWLIRNKIQTGVWGVSSISAYNLFYANVPMFLVSAHGGQFEQRSAELQQKLSISARNDGRSLRYSSELSNIATSYIKAEPFAYAKFHLAGLPHFFFSSGSKYFFISGVKAMRDAAVFQRTSPVFIAESFAWMLILALAIIGAIAKRESRMLCLWFALSILYFAILTGPVAVARYRLPASPFLFLLALQGGKLMIEYFYHERI